MPPITWQNISTPNSISGSGLSDIFKSLSTGIDELKNTVAGGTPDELKTKLALDTIQRAKISDSNLENLNQNLAKITNLHDFNQVKDKLQPANIASAYNGNIDSSQANNAVNAKFNNLISNAQNIATSAANDIGTKTHDKTAVLDTFNKSLLDQNVPSSIANDLTYKFSKTGLTKFNAEKTTFKNKNTQTIEDQISGSSIYDTKRIPSMLNTLRDQYGNNFNEEKAKKDLTNRVNLNRQNIVNDRVKLGVNAYLSEPGMTESRVKSDLINTTKDLDPGLRDLIVTNATKIIEDISKATPRQREMLAAIKNKAASGQMQNAQEWDAKINPLQTQYDNFHVISAGAKSASTGTNSTDSIVQAADEVSGGISNFMSHLPFVKDNDRQHIINTYHRLGKIRNLGTDGAAQIVKESLIRMNGDFSLTGFDDNKFDTVLTGVQNDYKEKQDLGKLITKLKQGKMKDQLAFKKASDSIGVNYYDKRVRNLKTGNTPSLDQMTDKVYTPPMSHANLSTSAVNQFMDKYGNNGNSGNNGKSTSDSVKKIKDANKTNSKKSKTTDNNLVGLHGKLYDTTGIPSVNQIADSTKIVNASEDILMSGLLNGANTLAKLSR